MNSKRPFILLDKTECLYKLVMASKISFAIEKGTPTIFKVDANDPEFIIRYALGERNFDTGLMNVKVLSGDLVEANGKVYQITSVQRCDGDKLVFCEATLADIPVNRAA